MAADTTAPSVPSGTEKGLDLHAYFGVAVTGQIEEGRTLPWRQVDGFQEDLLNPIPIFARQGVPFGLKCYPNLSPFGSGFCRGDQNSRTRILPDTAVIAH